MGVTVAAPHTPIETLNYYGRTTQGDSNSSMSRRPRILLKILDFPQYVGRKTKKPLDNHVKRSNSADAPKETHVELYDITNS